MVDGAAAVFDAAARYRKPVLFTSTSEVYGKSPKVPFSETDDLVIGSPTYRRWSYATAKALDELEREAVRQMPGGVYEKDGYLTDEALVEIRRAAPELDPAKLVTGLRKQDIPALLTVGFFVSMIGRKLTASGEGDPHA